MLHQGGGFIWDFVVVVVVPKVLFPQTRWKPGNGGFNVRIK